LSDDIAAEVVGVGGGGGGAATEADAGRIIKCAEWNVSRILLLQMLLQTIVRMLLQMLWQ
jgi:hypothetical protein